VLRAAGETETTQDWLQLDEGDPEFQILTGRNCSSDIFFCLFSSELLILLNFPFICFLLLSSSAFFLLH
jgi:hypothetical protein